MAEIESLELDITSNSTNATDALDRLTAALERLDKITGKATGVSKMNTKMTKLNSTLSNITKSVVSVYAIRKVADILGGFIKKSNDYVEKHEPVHGFHWADLQTKLWTTPIQYRM